MEILSVTVIKHHLEEKSKEKQIRELETKRHTDQKNEEVDKKRWNETGESKVRDKTTQRNKYKRYFRRNRNRQRTITKRMLRNEGRDWVVGLNHIRGRVVIKERDIKM